MFLLLLTASLSLLSPSSAGQPPNHLFQGGFCSISATCTHHNFTESLLEGYPPQQQLAESRSKYHPWTEEPQCISDEETKEEFCVYTNNNFASGRGISFFTSPKIAAKVVSLPAFTQPEVHKHANNFTNPPWEVRNVPGRGNSLFATRTLYRGDVVISDTPAGVYHSDAFFPDSPVGYKYLHKSFYQLPKQLKKSFMKLAATSPGDPIMERVNTNSFSGEYDGASHSVVFPETSFMNHDCRPNAMYQHDPTTLIHTTFAARTIHPGEEITITYMDYLVSRIQRQKRLSDTWGFKCTCSLCTADPAEARESDNRIRHIQELQVLLGDWSSESLGTPDMALELIKLYEEEGAHAERATGHLFAALAYNAEGDITRGKEHARLALEAGLVSNDVRDSTQEDIEKFLIDPTQHWSYNARKKE